MNKSKLLNFIGKYNLGGTVEQVRITSKDGKLLTSFCPEDRSILGFVAVTDFGMEDGVFGVYNTSTMKQMLGALQEDLTVAFERKGKKIVALNCYDESIDAKIMLADLDIIPPAPPQKDPPAADISIPIDSIFIDKFIKCKNALPESRIMAFTHENDKMNLVINYSDHNSDSITINLDATYDDAWEPMKFNSATFKEILIANKDCESGKIELSLQGLMTIYFKTPTTQTKYLLVMLQD